MWDGLFKKVVSVHPLETATCNPYIPCLAYFSAGFILNGQDL